MSETVPGLGRGFPGVPGYRIDAELGRGGMGVVYQARDLGGGRDVALKMTLGAPDEHRLARLRREGEANGRLVHPHVVRVHAAGEAEGRPYIVSELVPGARSAREVMRGASLPERVELVRQAAEGLGYAHRMGVVHRDVKPENLLVGDDGRLRVADFGLAHLRDAERLTRTGALLGTPTYMAPEQIVGRAAGAEADVWALGVLLYEALHDVPPFTGGSLEELMSQIVARDPPSSRLKGPLAKAVDRVCRRALQKAPEDRYPDGAALAAALAEVHQVEPPRRRRFFALGVVTGALLFGLAWISRSDRAPAEPPAVGARAPVPQAADSPAAAPASADRARPNWETPELTLRHGSKRGMACGAFAGDGQLVTVGDDGWLRRWTPAGEELPSVHLGEGAQQAPWSPIGLWAAGDQLVTGGVQRGLLRVLGNGSVVEVSFPLVSATWRGRRLAVGSAEGGVRIYEPSGRETNCQAGTEPVLIVLFSPDGSRLAVFSGASGNHGLGGNLLRLFDATSGELLSGPVALQGWMRSGAWTGDGAGLVVGSITGTVAFIDPETGEVQRDLVDPAVPDSGLLAGRAHAGSVRATLFGAGGTRLYTAARGEDESVLKAWDVHRGAVLRSVRLTCEPAGGALSPDGRLLVLGTDGGLVQVWRVWAGD